MHTAWTFGPQDQLLCSVCCSAPTYNVICWGSSDLEGLIHRHAAHTGRKQQFACQFDLIPYVTCKVPHRRHTEHMWQWGLCPSLCFSCYGLIFMHSCLNFSPFPTFVFYSPLFLLILLSFLSFPPSSHFLLSPAFPLVHSSSFTSSSLLLIFFFQNLTFIPFTSIKSLLCCISSLSENTLKGLLLGNPIYG